MPPEKQGKRSQPHATHAEAELRLCHPQRRSPPPLDRQARRHKVFRRRKLGAAFLPSFPSELVVATDRVVHRRWGCDAGLQTSPSTLVAVAACLNLHGYGGRLVRERESNGVKEWFSAGGILEGESC
nr:hypothetical protein Itr_chr06CG14940 [Ipomoea trifida]